MTGVFFAAAGLLVLAGLQKVADPKPLVRAFRSIGLRLPAPVVQVIAFAEVVVGTLALVTGQGVAVAVSYAVFTVFVLVARARGGVLASCGCFGKQDMPPTLLHAAVTAGFAVASVEGAPGAVPLDLALLVTTVALGMTAYLVLALLPMLRVR